LQRSSKAVKSNFNAHMRAVKDGRVTLADEINGFAKFSFGMLVGAPLLAILLGASLWVCIQLGPLGLVLGGAALWWFLQLDPTRR
jgi:hypothetical protein